jgi:DNA-binding protein H-NS
MEETTGSELEKIFRKFEDEVKERTKKEKEAKQEIERFGKEFTHLKKM